MNSLKERICKDNKKRKKHKSNTIHINREINEFKGKKRKKKIISSNCLPNKITKQKNYLLNADEENHIYSNSNFKSSLNPSDISSEDEWGNKLKAVTQKNIKVLDTTNFEGTLNSLDISSENESKNKFQPGKECLKAEMLRTMKISETNNDGYTCCKKNQRYTKRKSNNAESKKKIKIIKKGNAIRNLPMEYDKSAVVYFGNNIKNVPDTSFNNEWTNEIKTNVTPSKSEFRSDLDNSEQSFSVDTVYGTSCNDRSDILSNLGDSYIENNETLDSILPLVETDMELEDFSECSDNLKITSTKKRNESSVKYYICNENQIIVLRKDARLYIHGSFKLSVLHGKAYILGYELTKFSENVEIHSLRGTSYLYIENIYDGDLPFRNLEHEWYKINLENGQVIDILEEMELGDTVLCCTNLDSLTLSYLGKHVSQKLLPTPGDNSPVFLEISPADWNIIKLNPEWDKISSNINKSSKLMICGGKGVGKSTLLRFMINKLLMSFSKVLVLDLDPGQPEFTVSGCISAVLIDKPIFGPNFMHLQTPERCIFVENIDITVEPDVYLQCVVELLKQVEDFINIPVLINYMGYTQSYGINLISTVIYHVEPTIVLQINSSANVKNFPENLDVVNVLANLHMFDILHMKNLSYELLVIDSAADGITPTQTYSKTLREMCVISYLSQIVDEELSLTSENVPLYRISLKDVAFVETESKKVSNKAAIFNSSLVALCSPTNTSDVYNCYGWGVVRGVDDEVLVLITPVNEDILEKVTHLALGSATLPPSVLMYEEDILKAGPLPYVFIGDTSSFNFIPKRSYIPKKLK